MAGPKLEPLDFGPNSSALGSDFDDNCFSGSTFGCEPDYRCPDSIRRISSGRRKSGLWWTTEPKPRNIVEIRVQSALFRAKSLRIKLRAGHRLSPSSTSYRQLPRSTPRSEFRLFRRRRRRSCKEYAISEYQNTKNISSDSGVAPAPTTCAPSSPAVHRGCRRLGAGSTLRGQPCWLCGFAGVVF